MWYIHGNELSGKKALKNVFNYLEKESVEVRGNIIGIQGNLKAIEKKERYIDVDLNRIWKQKNINLLKKGKLNDKHEYKELKNIYDLINIIIEKKEKEGYNYNRSTQHIISQRTFFNIK